MPRTYISIKQGVTRHPDYRLASPLDFSLEEGQTMAICGRNGSGKSFLVDMLTGAHPLLGDAATYDFGPDTDHRVSSNVRQVNFRDVYGGNEPAYYQQRWNQADEQVFPTVNEVLKQACTAWGGTGVGDASLSAEESASGDHGSSVVSDGLNGLPNADLLREIGIAAHGEKPVNQLSSGELRRLQIAKMLLSCPKVLIIDNPYIGLDVEARQMLNSVLQRLAERVTLVLVVSRASDVPPFVRSVVSVHDKQVEAPISLEAYKQSLSETDSSDNALPSMPEDIMDHAASECVIDFRNIHIRYGERTILRDLNWKVMRGEHWALMGENGAGKSTLLSLVCADNPQGYACDIRLFGRQRGRGESIWDIKRHIGYVSPEIFSTYRKDLPAIDIVASGLRDTIGLYKRANAQERERCMEWMRVFGAECLADRNYMKLSSGEQRLILLVRAFVKSPDLLILDEPFHGLDDVHRLRAQSVIDHYMRQSEKTLIMVTHYEDELPSCIDHRIKLTKNK